MMSDATVQQSRTFTTVQHLPAQLPRRTRARLYVRKVVAFMVVKRDEIGKYSISQPLALCVLGAILTFGAVAYWRGQEQHDEIIRLRTQLELATAKDSKQDDEIAQARATAQIADRNAARLEGKFDQFSQIYTISNPKRSEREKE